MKAALTIIPMVAGTCIGLQSASAFSNQTPTPTPTTPPVTDKKLSYADIQKLFTAHCTQCHSDPHAADRLDLSSYETLMKGGSEGLVIVKTDPAKSVLYWAITATKGYGPMPPRGTRLTEQEIKGIEAWIKSGATKGS